MGEVEVVKVGAVMRMGVEEVEVESLEVETGVEVR